MRTMEHPIILLDAMAGAAVWKAKIGDHSSGNEGVYCSWLA